MNKNPINVGKAGSNVTYEIPQKYEHTMIYLTMTLELQEKGWQYQGIHNIFLGSANLFPDNRSEPEDLKIGYGKDLSGKILAIRSRVDRIRNGGDGNAALVKYKLIIEAGDTLLDSFEKISSRENPEEFFTQIKFKIV
jgi:hypothetical protein